MVILGEINVDQIPHPASIIVRQSSIAAHFYANGAWHVTIRGSRADKVHSIIN